MTGTDLCVNKPHCTAAAQCGLFTHKSVPVIFEPPCISIICADLRETHKMDLQMSVRIIETCIYNPTKYT